MNDLEIELTKIITNINNGTETTWGFITEQTPDVINQLLLWHSLDSILMFLVPLIVFIICSLIFHVNYKKGSVGINAGQFCIHSVFLVGSGIIGFFAGFISFLEFNITWLQIWIAPKVWILEYMTKMIK